MKQDRHYYFAYGSNMDMNQMNHRCPECELISTAKINGYRFGIDSAGVATIIPDETSVVYGVLWQVSENDIRSLDRYEGVATGCYRQERINVETPNGNMLSALVYISNRTSWSFPWGPGSGYIDNIIRWAEIHGFPDEYRDGLDGYAFIFASTI